MALIGNLKKQQSEDGEKEIFNAEFTNGTVDQLKELAAFLKNEGFDIPDNENEKLAQVIKVGISWLERQRAESEKNRAV